MATLEIALVAGAEPAAVTQAVKTALAEQHNITHSTVEIDWSGTIRACGAPSG